jgi:aminoglycoside/choline kinase family phosphotransferase
MEERMSAAHEPFLAAAGLAGVKRVPLPGDAGARRYVRLVGSALLLVEVPDPAECAAFLRLRQFLEEQGFSVPRLHAACPEKGLLLIEDFGERRFADLLGHTDPVPLFAGAAAVLPRLQAAIPPFPLPRWEGAAMARAAAETFLGWWWPAVFGAPPAPGVAEEFHAALAALIAPLAGLPSVLVHRDYFADNLFWLAERPMPQRIGLIDFQDAALGPALYDLVSLTEDARRALAPAAVAAALAAYEAEAPPLLRGARGEEVRAVLAGLRHLRVAGLWVRLARRDGKPRYLDYGPCTWRRLAERLAHPALSPLQRFFDRHIPPALRGNPPHERERAEEESNVS